ncbi:hypothetical protein Tco_0821605 [Tanacetum coccineum]|uniref:Retrovirus-related Pol polyprotein from transposon TNT 1-94 n=1 Tax=Tanacetum coccineum TaxID=301880 RepID=A0ABQ5AGY7_9ASTR
MLCYLVGVEPYYIKCIKDGPFQPKIAEGDDKPESQWTPDERRVVVQDQRLKSIIMSCLPDDIIESVISCKIAKATWTDLVYSFEGPSDTKKNRIMDLKLDLPEKWLTFFQGLRNANPTQTLNLADMYGRFVYEDNLIQRSPFGKFKFSKTSEPSYESPVTGYSSVSKGFQPKFTPKLIQSSQNSISQADPKAQKDYKAEYKILKAKITLLEANPSSSQKPKTFQPKNKGLVAETFNWDEEEVSDDEDVTQVKVNILLSMDEDADWQNYLKYINIDLKFVEEQRLNLLSKYNKIVFELNKCRDELLVLKKAKLDAVTCQIQNTELTKLNHALQEQLKEEKKINEKWLTSSKKSSSKMSENENIFVPASIGYDQEMVQKTNDRVERLNPDSKLPNFNTGRILVPESKAVNESLESAKTLNTPESSKDSKAESLTPPPPLKNL